MADNFDLEELVHIEQTFYDAGHIDGFAHGRIHGLIEGRVLGHQKGFEIWEEMGFYEGFALSWKAICVQRGQDSDQRAVHHINHLLSLIRRFPTVNPSFASSSPVEVGKDGKDNEEYEEEEELDMSKLERQIRSRYKALCASLGIRPTLRANAGARRMQAP